MAGMLKELSCLSFWGNARDVQTLTKGMISFAFRAMRSSTSSLTLSSKEAVDCLSLMLAERRDRCVNLSPKDELHLLQRRFHSKKSTSDRLAEWIIIWVRRLLPWEYRVNNEYSLGLTLPCDLWWGMSSPWHVAMLCEHRLRSLLRLCTATKRSRKAITSLICFSRSCLTLFNCRRKLIYRVSASRSLFIIFFFSSSDLRKTRLNLSYRVTKSLAVTSFSASISRFWVSSSPLYSSSTSQFFRLRPCWRLSQSFSFSFSWSWSFWRIVLWGSQTAVFGQYLFEDTSRLKTLVSRHITSENTRLKTVYVLIVYISALRTPWTFSKCILSICTDYRSVLVSGPCLESNHTAAR